jgi:Ca-activated chloride channel family protein
MHSKQEKNTQHVHSTATSSVVRDALVGFAVSFGAGIGASVLLSLLILLISSRAQAGERPSLENVTHGSLLFKSADDSDYIAAPTVNTKVSIHISGMVARATVIQSFTNPNNGWAEGIYVFPLPENAAVDHMRMHIGERIIEGRIKERAEAKKIYRQAKQAGKKTSLLEQERPNIFTTSLANIGPHETIQVELQYQQTLQYEKVNGYGQFELRFPMTINPRFIPGDNAISNNRVESQDNVIASETVTGFQGNGWALDTDVVPDASRITPPVERSETKINPVNLTISLDAGFPILHLTSPYHAVLTSYTGTDKVQVTLADGEVPADRDFVLSWQTEIGVAPKAALFSQTVGDQDYHLMMIMPPTGNATGGQPLPREVIYIIDTSGSMGGESIKQAKAALLIALERLRPSDSFNIIEFNSVTNLLFANPRPASTTNIGLARHYVQKLQADGGTEMYPALEAALSMIGDEAMVRQIMFLTDGSVGNETQLFDLIHQRLSNSRLFTIGIGAAPNSFFMRKAAQYGRGTFTHIGNTNEVQEKMQALFRKLENPILTNIQLTANGVVEYFPQTIPDLYLGEPVVIAVKAESAVNSIALTGVRLNESWRAELPLKGGIEDQGIGNIWARAKIGSLLDSLHTGADEKAVKQQVINLALNHHLVSRYTSLVAVDVTPVRAPDETLHTHALKNNLPKGSVYEKIFGAQVHLARTATPASLYLLLGAVLLLLSLIIHVAMNKLQRRLAM